MFLTHHIKKSKLESTAKEGVNSLSPRKSEMKYPKCSKLSGQNIIFRDSTKLAPLNPPAPDSTHRTGSKINRYVVNSLNSILLLVVGVTSKDEEYSYFPKPLPVAFDPIIS